MGGREGAGLPGGDEGGDGEGGICEAMGTGLPGEGDAGGLGGGGGIGVDDGPDGDAAGGEAGGEGGVGRLEGDPLFHVLSGRGKRLEALGWRLEMLFPEGGGAHAGEVLGAAEVSTVGAGVGGAVGLGGATGQGSGALGFFLRGWHGWAFCWK